MSRQFRYILCLLGLFSLVTPLSAEEPSDVIDAFDATLLQVMRNAEELGYQGRHDILAPVIGKRFDSAYICRLVLGRHWRGLDEAQRREMVQVFTELTIATYAGRFDGYDGQTFKVVQSRPLKRGRMLVRSELLETDGDIVTLDYVLQPDEGEWRIVNVVANGISDLSLKRAEYGAVVKRDGIDGLLRGLREKVKAYAEDAS